MSHFERKVAIPDLATVEDIGPLLAEGRAWAAQGSLKVKSAAELTKRLRQLRAYSADPKLQRSQRKARFMIHEEFAARGIAPAWRGDPADFVEKTTPKDDPRWVRLSDTQVIDIVSFWDQDRTRTLETEKGHAFDGLFTESRLNYQIAAQLAQTSYGYKWKVVVLKLTPLEQATAQSIKHPAVRDATRTIRQQRTKVEANLLKAYTQKPKFVPGKSKSELRTVAEQRAAMWECLVLADGSPKLSADLYRAATGNTITEDELKSLKPRIKNHLESVRSPYAAKISGLLSDDPWAKVLKGATDLDEGRKGAR